MERRLINEVDDIIKDVLDNGIQGNNLDNLYKLVDIKKDAYEIMCMEEGDDSMYYGRHDYDRMYDRDSYGARRRDSRGRYMGHEHLDRMYDDYSKYMASRERYGASSPDTKRSLEYMLRSMEDFARMLKEDAQSAEEVEMIRQTAQRIATM